MILSVVGIFLYIILEDIIFSFIFVVLKILQKAHILIKKKKKKQFKYQKKFSKNKKQN